METALISVIVPVYNVAQYLEKFDMLPFRSRPIKIWKLFLLMMVQRYESGRLCDAIAEQDDRSCQCFIKRMKVCRKHETME